MNASDLSTGSKLLLGASVVLFVDLFLSWQKACVDLGEIGNGSVCGSRSGWSGIGILVGLLVIAVIAWEVAQLTNHAPELPIPAALLSAALGAGVLLFGLISFLTHDDARHWPAWIGLLAVIAAGVGAYIRFNEAGGVAAIPSSRGSGGTTDGPAVGSTTSTLPPEPPAPSSSAPPSPSGPGPGPDA